MLNNIDKFEKLYNFLLLYRKSSNENFTQHEELLKLSKEIAEIGDKEYLNSSPIAKKVINAVYLFEFNRILNNPCHENDEFEKFWSYRIAKKVSKITNPSNVHQRKLIKKANEYLDIRKH